MTPPSSRVIACVTETRDCCVPDSYFTSLTCNCIRIATAATANSIVTILLASHPMLQTTSHLLPPTCTPLPTAAFITTPLLATLLLQNLSEPFTLPYYNSRNSLHLLLSHSASIAFSFLHAPLLLPSIPFAFHRASTNCSIHYYPSTSYLTTTEPIRTLWTALPVLQQLELFAFASFASTNSTQELY
jgi:hypothetical protein